MKDLSKTEFLATVFGWITGAASSDIGKFVLGAAGALFIAWFNTRLGIWRDERGDRRKRKGQLAYSTALLVSALREYMKSCMVVMNDEGERDTSGEFEDWKSSEPPPTFVYSDKIDWTLFDPQLMYDILSLPTIEARQKESVDWAYDQATPPDRHGFIEERQERYAELAAIAASHLVKIHSKHPMVFTSNEIGSVREITLKMASLEAARKKEQDENAIWLNAIQQNSIATQGEGNQ